jgi:hypothetical protein
VEARRCGQRGGGTRSIVLAACLFVAIPVRAEEAPQPFPAVSDVVYKGVVGKALDAVPMDPQYRVVLQRTNAVVSGTLTARSLAIWAGLAANPIFLVVGLVWGLFSASNIQPAAAERAPDTSRIEPAAPVEAGNSPVIIAEAAASPSTESSASNDSSASAESSTTQ